MGAICAQGLNTINKTLILESVPVLIGVRDHLCNPVILTVYIYIYIYIYWTIRPAQPRIALLCLPCWKHLVMNFTCQYLRLYL